MLFLWVLLVVGLLAGHALAQEGSGDAPLVREIAVRGNAEIDSAAILEEVRSTRVGEPFDTAKVQEDVARIAETGYFESVEALPELREDGVIVTFVVEEFPVLREVRIRVEGGVLSPSEVRALIGVEEGKILNAKAFGEDMEALPLRSDALGYLLRPVRIELVGARRDILEIDVAPLRVGEILIEGNEKTRENVIRREITVEPGEILSTVKLRNSLRRLGQLGYFEPIIPEFLSTSDPGAVDILLPVTELKTGRAAFGAGYSTADGLVGYVEVSDANFLGRGEQANLKWQFGSRTNTYEVGFMEPYLFGSSTSAGFNLYNTINRRQEFDANDTAHPYTTHRYGGDVTLGRPLGEFTRGFLSLKVENASVTPDTNSGVVTASSNRTRSITTTVRTDTTDHLFYPTLGFRYDIGLETAGRFLGGDTEFTKVQSSYSKFIKVGQNNQTLAFRVMAGYGTDDLPLQEAFHVGGPETVRGYRYGEFRGDRMVVAQAEYRFPVNNTIHGVVFVDAGNAWEGEPIQLGSLKKSVGVGVRFNTPLGVMRIDYGIGERGGNASFSLGPSF